MKSCNIFRKSYTHQQPHQNHNITTKLPSNSKIPSKSIKRDDLNEISVADQTVISNSNVDYHNMALGSITNQPNDKIGLISMEIESQNGKIIKNSNNNAAFNENVINQIIKVGNESNETATTASNADNVVESVNNRSRLENENCNGAKVEATFREQRRRERRERRQAR